MHQTYYQRHRKKRLDYQRKYDREHSVKCQNYQEQYRKEHYAYFHGSGHHARMKRYIERRRRKVILHYSGGTLRCACCGWQHPDGSLAKLQIDHINGGGRAHRKIVGEPYGWLIKNNFPPGFRILCAGCNMMMEPGAEKCLLHKGT